MTWTPEQRQEYDRGWWKSRSPEYKTNKIRRDKQRRDAVIQAIREYKLAHPCACGESHPACLDFHHVSDDKEATIGNVAYKGWSLARVMKEIAKCIVICANCHRKLHAAEVVGVGGFDPPA